MRTTRILVSTVAMAVGLAMLLASGPVSASPADERASFGKYNVKLKDSNELRAFGVAYKWRRKKVLIQRRPANGGAWRTARTVTTTRYGKFSTTLKAGVHIPCNGTVRYITRAKKKGTNQAKIDRRPDGSLQTWSC